jgi:hypothetical protein
MDYRIDQPSIQANSGGALLIEGAWHCPAMPGPLIEATTDHRSGAITTDLYATRIAARRPYGLKPKDGPDDDGYQRLSCPAAGSHPRLICPLRQSSLSPRDGRANVLDPLPAPATLITFSPADQPRPRLGPGLPARQMTRAARAV